MNEVEQNNLLLSDSVEAIDHWVMYPELKDQNVFETRQKLESFLDSEFFTPDLKTAFLKHYDLNAEQFKDKIRGPVHDEQHLAFVVENAIDILDEKQTAFPEAKRKSLAISLIIAAIEHDIGDIPNDKQYLLESLKHEEKSVEHALSAIGSLPDLDPEQKETISSLSKIMIISTSPSANLGPDIDSTFVSQVISASYSETDVDRDLLTTVQKNEFAKLIRSGVVSLKSRGWACEEILSASRMMAGADYSAYLGNPSIIEPIGLYMEMNGPNRTQNGNFTMDPPPSIENWLSSPFRDSLVKLYGEYVPQKALKTYGDTKKIFEVYSRQRSMEKFDPLMRLEGSITPAEFYVLISEMGLSEKLILRRLLIDYSNEFVSSLDKVSTNFSFLSTKLLLAISDNTELGKFPALADKMLNIMNAKLASDNSFADLDFTPYANRIALSENLIRSFFNNKTSHGYKENFRFKDLILNLRLDKDLDKLDWFRRQQQLGSGKVKLAIGGKIVIKDAVRAVNELAAEKSQLIVHSGYFESGEDPEEFFDKIVAAGSGKNVAIHIDRNPEQFLAWLKTDGNKEKLIEGKIEILGSPLRGIISNPHEALVWKKLSEELPNLKLTSNNSQAIVGGAGHSLVTTLEKIILHHKGN